MSPTDRSAIDDVRIESIDSLISPNEIMARYPVPEAAAELIKTTRIKAADIMRGDDKRLLVVIGPCSIHDADAARDYASRLTHLREQYAGKLEIVMRAYFEKPRTTLGWKGFINDPHLDGSFRINEGLALARELLLEINNMGMPTAGELLDAVSPQYIADLMSWGAIGARTTESQNHRQFASGVSCPIGFKNGTEGNIQIAVDAIRAAAASHHFLSVTKTGAAAIVKTVGNTDCHLILRGGLKPNFDATSVREAELLLENAGLNTGLMVDCSHANSQKDHAKQIGVCQSIIDQRRSGECPIRGVMIESNLVGGNQAIAAPDTLTYGKSITDACLGWEDSVMLLEALAGG
ncbi:MAG: 3-deoxy-7-phosphoheptulonate synthase [Luminiphilus sp.]